MKKHIVLITILVIVLLSMTLTGCSSVTEVELEPYISVRYQGNNGSATAVFDFDYADFEYAIMSQWERGDDNFQKLADLTALELTLTCEPSSLENLSNGDVIQVTMTYDEKLAKELGYTFRDVTKTFQAEGLPEAIPVDPFDPEYFSVNYSGNSPKISISVSNTAQRGNPLRSVQYSIDKDWDLRNGDTVTITAGFMPGYNMDGYALTRTETTLVIEDMDCYLTDPSALRPEDVAAIREKALEYYNSKDRLDFVLEDGTQTSLGGENRQRAGTPEFLDQGYAVLESGWGTQSTLILPFKVQVSGAEFDWWDGVYQETPLVQDLELYGSFRISGLLQTASGELIREGEFTIELHDCFLSQDALEQDIRSTYAAEELVGGTFLR